MFEKIIDEIINSNNIAISFHVSPDGDSIGSAVALMLGLRKLNKKVHILCNETVPEVLSFLPEINLINQSNGKIDDALDCLIILDCGNINRINCDVSNIVNRKYVLINIDHHLSNDYYGDMNWVETSHCAVGEMIYLLLKEMEITIDQDIAKCLYTSIITDCGGFKFSNTSPFTHEVAADLISKGIDFPEIHRTIYENKKFSLVKLAGRLIDNMYLSCNDRLCIIEAKKTLLEEFSVGSSDTSDLVSIGTEIQGVDVVVYIKDNEDKSKISLRSKTNFDVRRLAEEYGGGGHSKAAGFTYSGDIEILKRELIKKIGESL